MAKGVKKGISSEQAFDMLPAVAEIYEKLEIKKYIKDNQITLGENDDFKTMMLAMGLDIGAYVCKQSPKIKKEVFEIVAILEDKTMEEVLAQSPLKNLNAFKSLFGDKDTIDFLKQAVK